MVYIPNKTLHETQLNVDLNLEKRYQLKVKRTEMFLQLKRTETHSKNEGFYIYLFGNSSQWFFPGCRGRETGTGSVQPIIVPSDTDPLL